MAAIAQFVGTGVLRSYLTPDQQRTLLSAQTIADVWSHEAPGKFRIRLSAAEARRQIIAYASRIGVDPKPALGALPGDNFSVNGIALDADHRPIPVQHSDGAFALLLQDPPASDLEQIVDAMVRPFPAGLMTDAGLVVANPVFADATHQHQLDRNAYHGTVIWSWQQALFAAGLERQMARHDLPDATTKRLRAARQQMWTVINNTRDLRSSELWSWRFEGDRYHASPFGQNHGDADESNAAQLWSTVYLGIPAHGNLPVR
jgi:hypothetical protein